MNLLSFPFNFMEMSLIVAIESRASTVKKNFKYWKWSHSAFRIHRLELQWSNHRIEEINDFYQSGKISKNTR